MGTAVNIPAWKMPKQQSKVVTVFFIHGEEPDDELASALDSMHSSEHWNVVRLRIDHDIAKAFRVVKIPCLVVYSQENEETARAIGNINIQELITKVVL
jgi:hypothetical protein